MDLVHIFAPSFEHMCTTRCLCEGVCVELLVPAHAELEYVEFSGEDPLNMCRRYMAAVHFDECRYACDHWQTILSSDMYRRKRLLFDTFGWGDSGISLMTRMLARPETQASRGELRLELKHFLQIHANSPWMWTLMSNCCDVDQSGVEDALPL